MANVIRFTPEVQAQLDVIKAEAKIRHEKARIAAKKRGREYFPLLPYECSWAFEEEVRRNGIPKEWEKISKIKILAH